METIDWPDDGSAERVNHCVGRFEVPIRLIESAPWKVRRVLSMGVVVRAEALLVSRTVAYQMISEMLFEPVSEGELIPNYSLTVDADGVVTATRLP